MVSTYIFIIAVALVVILALQLGYIVRRWNKLQREYDILLKQMAESKNEPLEERQPKTDTDIAGTNSLPPERLYSVLSQAILSQKLYLNPSFGRQILIDRFSISKEQIGKAFSVYGTSLPQYINKARLEYACDLMQKSPELGIKEIAKASGFTTRESFGRSFKRQYGVSPGEFKKRFEE